MNNINVTNLLEKNTYAVQANKDVALSIEKLQRALKFAEIVNDSYTVGQLSILIKALEHSVYITCR